MLITLITWIVSCCSVKISIQGVVIRFATLALSCFAPSTAWPTPSAANYSTEQLLTKFALTTLAIWLVSGNQATGLLRDAEEILIQLPFDTGNKLYNDIWTLGKVLE